LDGDYKIYKFSNYGHCNQSNMTSSSESKSGFLH